MALSPGAAGGGLTGHTVAVAVEDSSQIGEARRVAMALAAEAGFDDAARSDIGIVATEAASNVVRHAGKGEVLVRDLAAPQGPGLEVVCVDGGPGMPDVGACLRDGYSSTGSMGTGFGAMSRLADGFSVYSAPGLGTALVCRFWTRKSSAGNGAMPAIAGLAVPIAGETACGDSWTAVPTPSGLAVLMADGLGHGPAAEAASVSAVRIFRDQATMPPVLLLDVLHAGMRSTRGAAVSVALIDRDRHEVRYAGVGNISAAIVTDGSVRHLVSHAGTVGVQMRKGQEFVYPWPGGAVLILHSDGLASQWKLDRYPGLLQEDPALVAAILYRDHARRRDDVSVVVCRLTGREAA